MVIGESWSHTIGSFINIYAGADVGHPGPGVAKPSVTGLVFFLRSRCYEIRYSDRNSAASS